MDRRLLINEEIVNIKSVWPHHTPHFVYNAHESIHPVVTNSIRLLLGVPTLSSMRLI